MSRPRRSRASHSPRAPSLETYSRAIAARTDRRPGQREHRSTRAEDVDDHLSATPIPESGVISVLGEDSTGETAMRFANVGGRRSSNTSATSISSTRRAGSCSSSIKKALEALAEARAARPPGQPVPPSVSARYRRRARQAAVGRSPLRREPGGAGGAEHSAAAGGCHRHDDDRSSFTQRAAFAGAVGGLLLGVALAMLLQARRPRPD